MRVKYKNFSCFLISLSLSYCGLSSFSGKSSKISNSPTGSNGSNGSADGSASSNNNNNNSNNGNNSSGNNNNDASQQGDNSQSDPSNTKTFTIGDVDPNLPGSSTVTTTNTNSNTDNGVGNNSNIVFGIGHETNRGFQVSCCSLSANVNGTNTALKADGFVTRYSGSGFTNVKAPCGQDEFLVSWSQQQMRCAKFYAEVPTTSGVHKIYLSQQGLPHDSNHFFFVGSGIKKCEPGKVVTQIQDTTHDSDSDTFYCSFYGFK